MNILSKGALALATMNLIQQAAAWPTSGGSQKGSGSSNNSITTGDIITLSVVGALTVATITTAIVLIKSERARNAVKGMLSNCCSCLMPAPRSNLQTARSPLLIASGPSPQAGGSDAA